jgi:hypothetical protein
MFNVTYHLRFVPEGVADLRYSSTTPTFYQNDLAREILQMWQVNVTMLHKWCMHDNAYWKQRGDKVTLIQNSIQSHVLKHKQMLSRLLRHQQEESINDSLLGRIVKRVCEFRNQSIVLINYQYQPIIL